MRTGPKGLIGLGLPAALRPHAPKKGGGAYAVRLNGLPLTLNGQIITLTPRA